MDLAVPLSPKQVSAAKRLFERVKPWQVTTRALDLLAERFADFGPEATLLKVVALNDLYGTNVRALERMSRHVRSVLRDSDLRKPGPDLVERLARMATLSGVERRYHSFAAKFAHFFIDCERFPMLDTLAEKMLAHHLARGAHHDGDLRYKAFVRNFQALRQAAGLQNTTREIDHYLWVAGLYMKFQANNTARINVDARRLFTEAKGEVAEDLRMLRCSS